MKKIFIILLILGLLSGCVSDRGINKEYVTSSDIESSDIDSSVGNTEQNEEHEDYSIGNKERKVESIGESYKDLELLSNEGKNKLGNFKIEKCYFKMKNIPKGFEEEYASLWEIGFFADYVNPETSERIEFNWWANQEPEHYIQQLKEISNVDIEIIEKGGIEYYCYFVKIGEEGKGKTPYHAEIRWVEDGKCMYLNYVSAKPTEEEVLTYCVIEKYIID